MGRSRRDWNRASFVATDVRRPSYASLQLSHDGNETCERCDCAIECGGRSDLLGKDGCLGRDRGILLFLADLGGRRLPLAPLAPLGPNERSFSQSLPGGCRGFET